MWGICMGANILAMSHVIERLFSRIKNNETIIIMKGDSSFVVQGVTDNKDIVYDTISVIKKYSDIPVDVDYIMGNFHDGYFLYNSKGDKIPIRYIGICDHNYKISRWLDLTTKEYITNVVKKQ